MEMQLKGNPFFLNDSQVCLAGAQRVYRRDAEGPPIITRGYTDKTQTVERQQTEKTITDYDYRYFALSRF